MDGLDRRQQGWRLPPRGLAIAASLAMIGVVSLCLLCLYVFSLHIAATKARGLALDAQIRRTRAQAEALRSEIEFRSRFVELGRWRTPLGLVPVGHGQYVLDQRQLGLIAEQRRGVLVSGGQAPADSCGAGDAVSPTCGAGPAGGGHGYAATARRQMDSLIGDILG